MQNAVKNEKRGQARMPIARNQGEGRPARAVDPFARFGSLADYARLIAESRLIPAEFRGRPADIAFALACGAERGLGVSESLRKFAGTPAPRLSEKGDPLENLKAALEVTPDREALQALRREWEALRIRRGLPAAMHAQAKKLMKQFWQILDPAKWPDYLLRPGTVVARNAAGQADTGRGRRMPQGYHAVCDARGRLCVVRENPVWVA